MRWPPYAAFFPDETLDEIGAGAESISCVSTTSFAAIDLMSESTRFPLIGYASVILCFLMVLIWQHTRISNTEQQVDRAVAGVTDPMVLAQNLDRYDSQQHRLMSVYGQSRNIMKAGFLLLIVLPTAVIFPILLAFQEAAPQKRRASVMHINEMTRDDVGRGMADHPWEDTTDPHKQLFLLNAIAFLVPTALLALFIKIKSDAYGGVYPGGVQSMLLLLVGTLIAFSGTAMVYPLKRVMDPARIKMFLGGGYVILAALAWFFL